MKKHSLKLRFALTIAVTYIVLGGFMFVAFQMVTGKVVHTLGTRFAVKQALLEKSKLMSAIQRDLTLSIMLSNSPILKRWALDEGNPEFKKAATEELERYRESFEGGSIFFAIDHSGNYYYSDGSSKDPFARPRYTLDPNNPNDAWYFRSMREVDSFELNVDYDNHLDVNKVWFNVVLKDADNNKIGFAGSGIDISSFIGEILYSGEKGLETIFFSSDGAIEGHRNKQYVIHNSKVRGSEKKITIYDLMKADQDKARVQQAARALSSGDREVETFRVTVEGKPYVAAMSYLKEIKWYNLVLLDAGHVVSSRDFLPILVVTVVSLFVIILLTGVLLNRRVLRPLSSLAEASNRIAVGDFDASVSARTNDEIGTLAACFNDMARMVKDHRENLEQKVNDRTEQLRVSNQKLTESNRQIMDSIRYARMIQSSILLEEALVKRHTKDFFAIYRPRDIVGGDFYLFREVGEDCVMAVVDCTGHGVPGAFMTMTAHAVLVHVLDTIGHKDPAAVLTEFNRQMRQAFQHDAIESDIDNGLDIGLCWYAAVQRRLMFAGARMELHQVTRGQRVTTPGDKQRIGYRRSNLELPYTNHEIYFADDTIFYLATDGILDQAGGPKGFGFGRKRFYQLLVSVSELPAGDRRGAVEQALADYQGDYPQRDDITVIGFRL